MPGLNVTVTGTVPDVESGERCTAEMAPGLPTPAPLTMRGRQAATSAACFAHAAERQLLRQAPGRPISAAPPLCRAIPLVRQLRHHPLALSTWQQLLLTLDAHSRAASGMPRQTRPPAPPPSLRTGKVQADYTALPHVNARAAATLTAAPKLDLAGEGGPLSGGEWRGGGTGTRLLWARVSRTQGADRLATSSAHALAPSAAGLELGSSKATHASALLTWLMSARARPPRAARSDHRRERPHRGRRGVLRHLHLRHHQGLCPLCLCARCLRASRPRALRCLHACLPSPCAHVVYCCALPLAAPANGVVLPIVPQALSQR